MSEAATVATKTYGLAAFYAQTDAVGVAVIVVMVLMSLASWYFIAAKAIEQVALRRSAVQTPEAFWSAADLSEAERLVRARGADPFAALALAGIEAGHQHAASAPSLGAACDRSDFVTRALRHSIVATTARLESGQTVLASVGSTAPFVGLFGTVWGIYHALIAIGMSGQASLDKVAGPVGEALIMTAAGIAVAIPAVLGYNLFVRANRLLLAQLDGFAHDLHAALVVGAARAGADSGAGSGSVAREALAPAVVPAGRSA
jgi:biopolymer transport protein ExbB